MHRPEKGSNLESESILVSAMVHLPQEWNFGSQTSMESVLNEIKGLLFARLIKTGVW